MERGAVTARGSRRPYGRRPMDRWRPARPAADSLPLRELRTLRRLVAIMALVLGAYCFLSAAAALYADTPSGNPNPEQLAARERYQWPGIIPVAFLALVVVYAVVIVAR